MELIILIIGLIYLLYHRLSTPQRVSYGEIYLKKIREKELRAQEEAERRRREREQIVECSIVDMEPNEKDKTE